MEITLPNDVPAMTLPNTALFPQALMPLRIFEPRYRHMLRDALASNRLFAVAGLNPEPLGEQECFEPPYRICTLGIIRACQKNDDGTSNLLLQGLCRIEVVAILRDQPYRQIEIRALASQPGASDDENKALRRELARLINLKRKLAASGSAEILAFLKTIDDPEAFVDIAAFSLCDDASLKQTLLETLDVHRRLELFGRRLRLEIENLRLYRRMQGTLPDDRIPLN